MSYKQKADELYWENHRLRERLDSLRGLVNQMCDILEQSDSISDDLAGIMDSVYRFERDFVMESAWT